MGAESWLVMQTADLVCHVLPTPGTDLIGHELDEDCVCGPRTEHVPRRNGTSGWVLVHPSLDGRELVESDRKRS
jgi:hypothetical protein